VRWSLRSQLLVIVALTVFVVIGASRWVTVQLVYRALEEDLEERVGYVLEVAVDLWADVEPARLQERIMPLKEMRRQVSAIDIFALDGALRWTATTRANPPAPETFLDPDTIQRLKAGETVRTTLPKRKGAVPWRVAVPLVRDGSIVGAAQVEVWPSKLRDLERRLDRIQGAILASSVVALLVLLLWFFERRIARPVASLCSVMRQAEAGDLGVRAAVSEGGEFGVLANGFNKMLAHVETFNTALQTRVDEATRGLAEKNRELGELNENLHRCQLEAARRAPLAAVGQMASTIAHELGTPLNSVLGYTQLLLRQEMTADQRGKLTIIESQVGRMIETIQGILDRTRTQVVPRMPLQVARLVDEALTLVSQRTLAAGVRVRTDLANDLPMIQGDAVGLRQILVNLLTNAIDATSPEGTVTVRARILPEAKDMASQLELAVEDTGKGMRPEELRRIFEPFYTTKDPHSGTGLGLAIVNQIVADHSGRVFAESEPGRGTTIRVQLPLEP